MTSAQRVGYLGSMAPKTIPPVRVDAVSAVVTALEVIVVLGTLKVIAYRFHGNKFAQAYLTLF